MIELWPRGTDPLITDFQQHGIRIHPSESTVKYEENGQFNLEMVVPVGSGFTDFDYGQIIRATVPEQKLAEVDLGEVSYYEVTASGGTDLLKTLPSSRKVSYAPWEAYRSYSAGDKRSSGGKNWRCTSSHGGLSMPPPAGGWTEISGIMPVAGQVVEHLDAEDILMKTADFNSDYMEAATLDGAVGYVKKSDVTATGETEERTVDARTIKAQNFVVSDIKKTTDGKSWRIYAEHISYQLGRTMLGDCKVVSVTPATALLFIAGAMQETYGGNLYTDLSDFEITGDWSWKNAQSAILDPKSGIVHLTNARVVRDDLDVFILSAEAQMPSYVIRYGANLKSVNWDGSVTSLVTRVYPIAQNEDGSTLLLPEKYIDTVRTVPFINPEPLNTGLKVGQKEKKSDGTEVELTEADVITRMREMASNRFNIDKCDQAEIRLDLDWLHMPDTEEYAQYRGLADAAPGDWVQVYVAELGISELIRMTGYTYDPETERYKGATFGTITQKPTVASYNLKSGSVNASAIATGAITGQHMQAGTITAREIEANSITADKIASRSITTELLVAGAVTADEIAANSISTEKLQALSVTTEKLAAQSITTEKLAAYAITAAKIAANTITADKIDADDLAAAFATVDVLRAAIATISEATIESADISVANIKDLTAENFIAHDAVTDRYFIHKLAVENAQMVQATVGELIVKASNGNYYRLDIDEYGVLSPTQVTNLTNEEIAAGVTSDGRSTIIETDLTVADLSATNMKAINALIDKLTAARIDVDELFARQATITQLNTVDIRGNTYLQMMVEGYGTTYQQWTDPASEQGNIVKDGDVWYRSAPVHTHNELATMTHNQLAAYTHKALEGYEQYIRKDGAWIMVSDPVTAQHTIAQVALETAEVAIRVEDTWEGVAALRVATGQIYARVQDTEGALSALDMEIDSILLAVADKYGIVSGIALESAGVQVSGNKYINLDVNANNYVHINQSGIDVYGNRIKINGKEVFGRDDIIILTNGQTESSVISAMSGHHDWVMIKPYYNAELNFTYGQDYRATSAQYNTNVVQMARENTGANSFGTGASWYQYVLSGDIAIGSGETHSSGAAFTVNLSNSRSLSNAVTAQSTVDTSGSTATFSISSGHVSRNLCGEGETIWLRLDSQYAYEHIRNLKLVCTCDSTTSRVPCTVYYFP